MKHSRTATTILLALFAIVQGCSKSDAPAPTASITGEVKRMSGEPVGKVTVIFYPTAGPTYVAKADDGGKFTADVQIGECRVAVVAGGEATPDTSPSAVEAAAAASSKVNPRFASPETSGLTVKVEQKQTEKVVLIVD